MAELEKTSRREKTDLANAHERAMQLSKEMHVLDKNNLATELAATRATLASCQLERAQTKKLLETARSDHMKFLQDQSKIRWNTTCLLHLVGQKFECRRRNKR